MSHINSSEPCCFTKVPVGLQTLLLMPSGPKKQTRYTCLSEVKASHSQRMWAKISFSAPHLLHIGLSDQWRTEGGLGVQPPPPRNSEVLTKSNRIAN